MPDAVVCLKPHLNGIITYSLSRSERVKATYYVNDHRRIAS